MGTNRMDQGITGIHFRQQFGRLFAMFFRIHLKVHIVEQAAEGPEVRFFSIAQFGCEPTHDTLNGQTVLDVERFLVVLLQQGKGLLSCQFHGKILLG